MEILAHRGIWSDKAEQNTLAGLEKAIVAGFGVELDVRDYCGNLVLSHDIADELSPSFMDFLEIYVSHKSVSSLAVNIKSDGLATLISTALEHFGITSNYFCFDMSVPERFTYLRKSLTVAQRISQYDFVPAYLESDMPVWVDTFGASQLPIDNLNLLVDGTAPIAIVSNELHGQNHIHLWQSLQNWIVDKSLIGDSRIMLCTDFPFEAEVYFNARD
jgi:hypothetical protein